jgi:para-nitrobenzyl esterase
MDAGLGAGLALMVPTKVSAATQEPTAPIETTSGRVRGLCSGALSRFFGIPYGDDTGARRFQPPLPAKPWTGVRDCFSLGAKAPQGPITIPGVNGRIVPGARALSVLAAIQRVTTADVPESEDCLVLNVITPNPSRRVRRPVMVWLHGGAFAMGSGFDAMNDGSRLASKGDLVFVSLNHRLNALGYLYLGQHHEDFADSGNSGQLDIVLALRWVRDNIAAFGGDPDNVTIFGESGGGLKVSALMGTRPARGLFHKAIVQSGAAVSLVDRDDAAEIADRTLQALGVARADVHRLQTMDPHAVIAAASAVRLPSGPPWLSERTLAPVVDGRAVPAHPFSPAASELSRDVPMMIGTCKDECTLFLAGDPDLGAMSVEEAKRRFHEMLGDLADAAFDLYREQRPDDQPSYWVTSLMTDRMFRTASIVQADRKADQEGAPVFMYRFDYEPRIVDQLLRTPHGTEVPLVFGTLTPPEFIGAGPEVRALSAKAMQAWIRFARTGEPTFRGMAWPRYKTGQRLTMIFDAPTRLASDPDRATREFWTA